MTLEDIEKGLKKQNMNVGGHPCKYCQGLATLRMPIFRGITDMIFTIPSFELPAMTAFLFQQHYGISRKTGYKWVDRYVEEGVTGLVDRLRRPKRSPQTTPSEEEQRLLAVRQKHPTWGGSKILAWLQRQCQPAPLLSRSTVMRILRQHGCMTTPRKRPRRTHPGNIKLSCTYL